MSSDELDRIKAAARAVIDQWHTPNWRLTTPTATLIHALREALGDPVQPMRFETCDPRDQRIGELEDEVKRLRQYAGAEIYKSDFQTAGHMRAEVNRQHIRIVELEDEAARLRTRAVEAHQWEEAAEHTGLPLKPDAAKVEIERLKVENDNYRKWIVENEKVASEVYSTPHGESFSETECISWLVKEVKNLRQYAGAEIYKSEFQTAGHMRAELQRLRKIEAAAKAANLIGPDGNVRKVLGKVAVSADECIIGVGGRLYTPPGVLEDIDSPLQTDDTELKVRLDLGDGVWANLDESLCYSTPEAAEAARKEVKP